MKTWLTHFYYPPVLCILVAHLILPFLHETHYHLNCALLCTLFRIGVYTVGVESVRYTLIVLVVVILVPTPAKKDIFNKINNII